MVVPPQLWYIVFITFSIYYTNLLKVYQAQELVDLIFSSNTSKLEKN